MALIYMVFLPILGYRDVCKAIAALIYMVFLPISGYTDVSRMSWPKFTWFFWRYQVTQCTTDIDAIKKAIAALIYMVFFADIRLHRQVTRLPSRVHEISFVTARNLSNAFNNSDTFLVSHSLPLGIAFNALATLISFIPVYSRIVIMNSETDRKAQFDYPGLYIYVITDAYMLGKRRIRTPIHRERLLKFLKIRPCQIQKTTTL